MENNAIASLLKIVIDEEPDYKTVDDFLLEGSDYDEACELAWQNGYETGKAVLAKMILGLLQ